jgi:hypothetical protein
MRLYVKPHSKLEATVLDLLLAYGLKPSRQEDQRGVYYDVTPPEYWSKYRKYRFLEAVHRVKQS